MPVTKKMPSEVGNADCLCRGLELFERLVGVNRTSSDAKIASHLHPRTRSAAETRSAASYPRLPGESDDDYGAFWASRTCFGLRPLPPKSMSGPSLPRASEGQAARLCERR
jgi:hypothetical protein